MPPADGAVVALLIGELHYMNGLNRMSTAIVEHAVERWRAQPGGLLICEAAPMVTVARALGVPEERIRIAIPEPAGHTTRWAAERVRAMADVAGRPLLLVTHRLHGARAQRMFQAMGLDAALDAIDLPFDAADADWKLRSESVFRLYNAVAWAYVFVRRWV